MATTATAPNRDEILMALIEIMSADTWEGTAPTKRKVWETLAKMNAGNQQFRYQLMAAGDNKIQAMYGALLMAKFLFPELFRDFK